MAQTVIEKLLVSIEGNATKLTTETSKGSAALKTFGKDATAAGTQTAALGQQAANAARGIAGAAESMARSGKIGGEGLKAILTQGSNLAFMFGATGAVVGAVSIASLAIVELFQRANRETEEQMRQVRANLREIRELQVNDLGSAVERQRRLGEGNSAIRAENIEDARTDPNAKSDAERVNNAKRLKAEQAGVIKLREQERKLLADIRAIEADATLSQRERIKKNGEVSTQLQETRGLLQAIGAEYDALTIKVNELAKVKGGQQGVQLADDQRKRDEAAAERAAEKAKAELKSFRDALDGLTQGDAPLDKIGARFEKLREQAAAFAKAGVISAKEYQTAIEKLDSALEREISRQQAEIAQQLKDLGVAMTSSLIDDLENAIEQKAGALRKKIGEAFAGDPSELARQQARVDAWENEARAQVLVARQQEEVAESLRAIEQAAEDAGGAQLETLGQVDALYERTVALLSQLVPGTVSYANAQKLLLDIEKKRAELGKQIGNPFAIPESKKQKDTTAEDARRLGRTVEDIGRLTLAAADAFGKMNDEATKALAAVVDVGAGIARAFSGDIAGGLTQGSSGLITLAGQAFGKDPAAAQRQRDHQENLATLKAIQKNTGDLLNVQTSGRDIASITGAVSSLLGRTGDAGGFRKFSDFGINEAGELERLTGLSFKEIEELAKSLGITLNGTKQSYLDFLQALKSLDLEAFGKGFAGRLRQLEIEARLDPSAFEGINGLIRRIQILTGPDGAPALAEALKDLDLTTESGRAEAIRRLSEMLRNISSLDPSDLGGLSLEQFINETLAAIEALRDAQPKVSSAFEKIAQALDDLMNELELLDVDDAAERARRIAGVVAGLVPSIAEALAGLDLSTLEGSAEADRRIAALFADRNNLSAIERGGLSVEEFTNLLLKLDAALDAATGGLRKQLEDRLELARREEEERKAALDAEERAAEEARARRVREAIERARNESTLAGEGTEARLRRLVAALGEFSPAIKGLLDGLDLSTAEGLFEFNRRLQALFESLGEGADLGELSIEELIEALLDLRGGSDDLAKALEKVVTEAERAAASLAQAFADLDFDLALRGITDPLERLRLTALAVAQALPAVSAALEGLDLATETGRAAAEAALIALGQGSTDPAVRDAVLRLLEGIRAVQPSVPTEDGASAPQANDVMSKSGVENITERTGNQLVAFGESAFRQRNVMIELLRTLTGARTLAVPNIPRELLQISGGFNIGSFVFSPTVNIEGDTRPGEAANLVAQIVGALKNPALVKHITDAVDRELGNRVREYRRFRGGA